MNNVLKAYKKLLNEKVLNFKSLNNNMKHINSFDLYFSNS